LTFDTRVIKKKKEKASEDKDLIENQIGKRKKRRRGEEDNQIYNPQLDMLLKMIQEEEKTKLKYY
jgi:hypothetical protein